MKKTLAGIFILMLAIAAGGSPALAQDDTVADDDFQEIEIVSDHDGTDRKDRRDRMKDKRNEWKNKQSEMRDRMKQARKDGDFKPKMAATKIAARLGAMVDRLHKVGDKLGDRMDAMAEKYPDVDLSSPRSALDVAVGNISSAETAVDAVAEYVEALANDEDMDSDEKAEAREMLKGLIEDAKQAMKDRRGDFKEVVNQMKEAVQNAKDA